MAQKYNSTSNLPTNAKAGNTHNNQKLPDVTKPPVDKNEFKGEKDIILTDPILNRR